MHPSALSASGIAKIAGYDDNPVAISAIEEWLSSAPLESGINVLDLYYWEHRVGNWGGMIATQFDSVADMIPPYNCRSLLQTALSVDVAHRRKPCDLFRRVCAIAAVETLRFPFNDSLGDRALERMKAAVPWRLQQRLWRMRMRYAGIAID